MNSTSPTCTFQRRWLNEYNKRIRDEVGAELKRQLRPTGYKWMMKNTRNIPEWGPVNRDYFEGKSEMTSKSSSLNLFNGIIIATAMAQYFL